jgi:phosphoenolpyruvate carboxykinase (ATP)
VIRLSEDAEPQIFACTRRFGTVLENVTFDQVSRHLDLNDYSVTENTRAAYPLSYIENHLPEKRAGHPKNVIFLTCDASGVMPPISKLTPDQAIYHFISGYTSKIAGTEIGLGVEPQMTFSTCFGGPFMVHHPLAYAELLKNKIQKHNANVWLVNTGWTGGPFGVGKRISIQHTRALLNAALSGSLLNVPYKKDPVFGLDMPTQCEGVPSSILDPVNTWPSREEYFQKYDALAARFIENFKLMLAQCPEHIREAGPKRLQSTPVR